MITAVLFISFFVMLAIGVPIAICLGASSAAAIFCASHFTSEYSNLTLSMIATNTYTGIGKFLLLAIPFFVLSGNIMAKAGISGRLVRFIDSFVGHKRGGMAICCVRPARVSMSSARVAYSMASSALPRFSRMSEAIP